MAAGDDAGVDAALTAAGFSDDTSDPADYWSLVKALLDRHHLDDVRIAMTAGSIDTRGDGIRAYYATPHDSNGGISVTVGEGVSVTGGQAGVYVANAGPGLQVARKYTYGFGMNDGATADDLVAVTYGEGADEVALRNQLVTVAGTVTGGTDAAVRLSGGGAVIVMEGGEAHAGASGVGILADGPALVYVDGEVKGGEGGAAAVRLSGGGIVTVGPNGRVQANGAGHAIQGGATAATMVALTLVTDRLVPYREDVNAQVDGSLAGVENARLREYRDGVPTGYSQELRITADGMLDTSKLPPRPASIIDCAADGRCSITEGETIPSRHTGLYAAVERASATAADQPLIDVTWTARFSHGAGYSGEGRFEAETVGEALVFDRESAAVKVVERTIRWGTAAGIEAHALSWRDVAAQAAKGDDPGPIADAAAQTALLATSGAASRRTAILAQLRAALGNADLAVAASVLTAIDSTATSVSDLSDTEIVAYLSTDDAPTRVLLRNVLAQGLSDGEKAVLRAVAAGDGAGLDAALTAAGFTDDPADDSDYWSRVKGLLDRYNVGDIRIAMNAGSIDSRGDGIRAYYATPHDDNGGISVSVAEGASVTADLAGIHVANASGDVTVTSGGTVLGMAEPGIYAANKAGAAGDVTVNVTGGEVRSTGRNEPAVWAWNRGTGDVTVTIDAEATAISKHAAGIFALLGGAGGNRLEVTQGGTVMGRTGVYALAAHGTTAETVTPRAADDQPLIDVTWTGAFSHGTEADVAPDDNGRFGARTAGEAIAFDRESAAGKAVEEAKTVRWDAPAGIEAQAMSWRAVAETVAAGDDPGMLADDAARAMAFDTTSTDADLKAKSDALVRQVKAMLDNDEIVVEAGSVLAAFIADMDTDGDEEYTEEELAAYLARDDDDVRAGLQALMALGLSEAEKKVLKAVAAGDSAGLATALDAADAGFTDAYKTAVRALLDHYNVGDVRIAMTAGSIDSRGDGIRAYYATPHDKNGGISVTVAEGASVTGARAGVYVANAGEGLMLEKKYTHRYTEGDDPDERVAVTRGEGADEVPLLDQLVTVAGTVTGGTDAAIHLSGGGAVIVEKDGSVLAGSSGVAILVNDPGPALIYIDGEVRGGVGGAAAVHLTGGGDVVIDLNGNVDPNGAANAIQGGGPDGPKVDIIWVIASQDKADVDAAHERVKGPLDGVGVETYREDRDGEPTGYTDEVRRNPDGTADTSRFDPEDDESGGGGMTLKCEGAGDQRCRLYEALPSMLLAMNALPSWAERSSAARGANGVWGRVEAARGKWRAKKSTMETIETPAGKLAYDHRWTAGHAGVDFHAGESGRVGLSVHALGGKAEMSGVGEVELNALGGGLSATSLVGDLYVDAQAALTLYDVDVESYRHGKLKKAASGVGYALGVEAGRRMPVGETFVTPRAGLSWSQVDFADFADDYEGFGDGPRARVKSVDDARSLKGRLGVMVETEAGMGAASGRLYGSLDVEQELSDETEVKVGGQVLKTEVRPTSVHLGAGGEFDVGESVVVRATAGYRTSGSGTSGYGGGLEVRVRF